VTQMIWKHATHVRDQEVRESYCHRCIVELNNKLDARGVMLNLASLISALILKPKESDCQRFNVKLDSNLITVRGVVLNLIVICQRCSVNMIRVGLRYEQFWGLVILLRRIDKWSLECQGCSVNLTRADLWYE